MTTLKIDYDGFKHESTLISYLGRHRFVWKFFNFDFRDVGAYKTRRGWHIYLKVANKFDAKTVVFLQALLGSDFKRESFNWDRLLRGMGLEESNVLFEKKRINGKIVSEEKFLPQLTAKLREMMMDG